MKAKKLISVLVLTMLLTATIISPASAAQGAFDMPNPDFNSIWNLVQTMIKEQEAAQTANDQITKEPAPDADVNIPDEPAPEPVPVPEQKPEPAPAPTPTPAPAPEPAPAPAPVLQPEPAPAPNTEFEFTEYELRVLELVNIERQKEGLQPLKLDVALTKAARAKAKDMVDNRYFSHTSPTWGSFGEQLRHFGIQYRNAGENIASGQRTPEAVVRAWMNSSGHRANIMNAKFNKMGLGYAYTSQGNYHHYWAQWFAN